MASSEKKQRDLLQRLINSLIQPEAVTQRYKISGQIGAGAFGSVSKVEDVATKELGAMKTLPFDPRGKDNVLLKREIENIVQLRPHINIVRLLDIFKSDQNELHIIMELCNGDLLGYMKSDDFQKLQSRFNVAQQIANGINVLHTHSPPIIHRDVKPQNILYVRDAATNKVVIKIADFGISSSAAEQRRRSISAPVSKKISRVPSTDTLNPMGTRPYMAPECFAAFDNIGWKDGKFLFDASVDIFALGLVYAHLFCDDNVYGELASLYKVSVKSPA